ncbi:MAG TPA: 3-deoxy-D-manno-octulosonic acid transferase [Gemmataceae bacterium]|nr:3-deoxy-D-manno-octulosonic acid transferase [Gemmataceae bacterium]
MAYLLNLVYFVAWLALSPWLCWQAWLRKKPICGLWAKWFGRFTLRHAAAAPTAWFHGVSVGEIHLLRQVVAQFRVRFPGWRCVVSTTTATGHAEAIKQFPDLDVIFWPFDFTWAVDHALRIVQPTLVILSEGEMWPNFVAAAKRRGVKLAVINGRMSPRSAARFRRLRWLVARLFGKIDWIGAQNDEYRQHYLELGATNVASVGNIKYDGVNTDRHNARTQAMRELFSCPSPLTPHPSLIWVAGSTQAPEEALAIEIYRRARERDPQLRLILVPRHPERFDEVAQLLQRSGLPFVRRSSLSTVPNSDAIILVDTIGELSAIWGLADIAFVGGSLDGKRGGQNMIEPSAYGAAVVFGPHTWNFKQTVNDLLAHSAALQVQDGVALEAALWRLLEDATLRRQLGEAARRFVLSQQGATGRTLDALRALLDTEEGRVAA